jgi:hypothetical protein
LKNPSGGALKKIPVLEFITTIPEMFLQKNVEDFMEKFFGKRTILQKLLMEFFLMF